MLREQLIEDVHVRQVTFGTGYIMTGQAPGQDRAARPASIIFFLGLPVLGRWDSSRAERSSLTCP